jgi:hypothetical protein
MSHKLENFDKPSRYTFCNDNSQNENYSIATELRIVNLEKRLENTEKMLKFYEEMLRLKDEEKRNETKIDHNKINELSKKVSILEENIKFFHKKLYELNNLVTEKFELIDKKISKINEIKSGVSDFYANKLSEIETMVNKNNIVVDNLIEDKIEEANNDLTQKFDDMLSLITEIGRVIEKNDNNTNELKESISHIQNDHLSFVKIVSILKEKADSLDYVMNQITDMKQRYGKFIALYGEQSQEEDKFLQKMFNNTDENQ